MNAVQQPLNSSIHQKNPRMQQRPTLANHREPSLKDCMDAYGECRRRNRSSNHSTQVNSSVNSKSLEDHTFESLKKPLMTSISNLSVSSNPHEDTLLGTRTLSTTKASVFSPNDRSRSEADSSDASTSSSVKSGIPTLRECMEAYGSPLRRRNSLTSSSSQSSRRRLINQQISVPRKVSSITTSTGTKERPCSVLVTEIHNESLQLDDSAFSLMDSSMTNTTYNVSFSILESNEASEGTKDQESMIESVGVNPDQPSTTVNNQRHKPERPSMFGMRTPSLKDCMTAYGEPKRSHSKRHLISHNKISGSLKENPSNVMSSNSSFSGMERNSSLNNTISIDQQHTALAEKTTELKTQRSYRKFKIDSP